MSDFVVSTVFKGKDQVSKIFKAMGTNADKFGNKAKLAFKKSSKEALTFKKLVGGILTANIVQRGIGVLRQGTGEVINQFIDFDQAITAAGAKFPVAVKRGTKAFNELGKAARKVGAETQFTAADAAGGLNFLAMAGFNASQAMALLPRTVDLATVGEMDLARATDIASDALGAFGLMTDDTAQLTKNLNRVNDVFAKTITSSNVDLETLFDTMKMAGPIFDLVDAGIEEFSATAGLIGSAGIKGTIAGTTLRQAMLSLSAPTKNARKEFAKLNIALSDSKGNLRDPVTLLGEFAKKTEEYGTTQKAAAIKTIFGQRAIAGVSKLLDLGGDKIDDYRVRLQKAGGASKEMADNIRQSLQNRLAALKSALIEVGFKFIDAFGKKAPGMIDKAIDAVRKFDIDKAVESIGSFAKFIGATVKKVKELSPLLIGLVAGFAAYRAVMISIAALESIRFFFALARALRAAAVSQGILNAIMALNPVVAIATAIALLITGIVLLVKNWDTVKEKVLQFGQTATKWIKRVWSVIDEMLNSPFFVGVGALVAPWLTAGLLIVKMIKDSKITWEQFVDAIVGTTREARRIIVGAFVSIGLKIIAIKNKISELLENPFFVGALTLFAPAIALTAVIIKQWEKISGIIDKIITQIAKLLPMADSITGLFGREKSKSFGLKGASVFGPVEEKRQFGGTFSKIAPNKTKVEVAQQKVGFEGRLDIAGAPVGSSFKRLKTKGGAPKFDVNLLGVNP